MKFHYQTDPGKVRTHNEDSVTIVKNLNGEYLLMVADGMGGHKAGEVASSMAVTTIGSRFQNMSSLGSKMNAVTWLKEIVEEVNTNIINYAEVHTNAKGLGTTLVCAILTNDYLIFGNIGDSSGYVYKNKEIYKVTKDHTLVNILVESGELRPEEAANHPQKNVLMRALGASEKAELDIFDVERTVDGIFLCSDGLTNMVSKETIERVLSDEDLDLEEKVDKLIIKANIHGGSDNISIACMLIKEGE